MKWFFPFLFYAAIFAVSSVVGQPQAQAYPLPFPERLPHEILSESIPTAIAPVELDPNDFSVEWEGAAIQGVSLRIVPQSFEWVRVAEMMTFPRARLVIDADDVEGGTVSQTQFIQPFVILPGVKAKAEAPIALMGGADNPIELVVRRAGKELKGRVLIRYRPKPVSGTSTPQTQVAIDPSCSRFGVTARVTGGAPAHAKWMMVGCRMIQVEGENSRTSSLETLIYWEGAGREIEVGGVTTPATSVPSLWAFRLQSEPGKLKVKSETEAVELSYFIPKNLHRGSVSLGVGPYAFHFSNGRGGDLDTWVPMPTLYVSYGVAETARIVAFDATTVNSLLVTDFGVYLNTEYFRTLDRRIVINLMLGFHFNGFRNNARYNFVLGAPQGAEVIFNDFLGKARNLSLGGFIYPTIEGKSYYNTWFRWGSPKLFAEFNYIAWEEKIDGEQFSSRSMGISVGVPLPFLKFL